MALINCSRCGKVMEWKPTLLCPACLIEQQDEYHKIKLYLFHHPNATVMDIHNQTGIALKVVRSFAKDHVSKNAK